jgi:hypothetical protein
MSVELSVVVPVCNEAENVEPLAREIDAALAGRAYETTAAPTTRWPTC